MEVRRLQVEEGGSYYFNQLAHMSVCVFGYPGEGDSCRIRQWTHQMWLHQVYV